MIIESRVGGCNQGVDGNAAGEARRAEEDAARVNRRAAKDVSA